MRLIHLFPYKTACTSVMLCLLLTGHAAAQPDHAILETEQPVIDFSLEDINGDALPDLVVLSGVENNHSPKKYLEVFLATAETGYSKQPSFSMPLDQPWSVYFFAETDGARPRELLAANGEGVTIFRFQDTTLLEDRVINSPSLYPISNKGARFLNAAIDLNADGLEEWLAPTANGFSPRNINGTLPNIPCGVENYASWDEQGWMRIVHRYPTFKIFSQSDEHKGIAFLNDDLIEYFSGEGWQEKRAFTFPVPGDEKWRTDTYMEDVQGNGFPDVLIARVRGSLSVESELLLYLSQADGSYTKEPSSRYSFKGDYVHPALRDINGDGQKDLILIKVPFGVKNLLSYFMQHRITVVAACYLFNGKGYPQKPNFQTKLTMEAPEDSDNMAYAMGDFNGDGRLDVAFGKGKETMMVHLGEENKFIANKAWKKLKLPADGRAKAVRLDADETDDLIVTHHNKKHQQRIDVIRF